MKTKSEQDNKSVGGATTSGGGAKKSGRSGNWRYDMLCLFCDKGLGDWAYGAREDQLICHDCAKSFGLGPYAPHKVRQSSDKAAQEERRADAGSDQEP